jgi:hypothetical protein
VKQEMKQMIYERECALLDPLVRHSRAQLEELIGRECIEIGSSGNIYTQQDIIEALLSEQPRTFAVQTFTIRELSPDVMLATYQLVEENITSLRSSIWKREAEKWQLVFHQGTRVSASTKRK